MTSDEKTFSPSLIANIRSDLFTLDNIANSVRLIQEEDLRIDDELDAKIWDAVVSYLPLDFFRLLESYPNMYTTEKFDVRYNQNPKLCAYERYGTTNMWRPLMILNRCPSITKFNFEFIKYYNVAKFTEVLSVLIARNMT